MGEKIFFFSLSFILREYRMQKQQQRIVIRIHYYFSPSLLSPTLSSSLSLRRYTLCIFFFSSSFDGVARFDNSVRFFPHDVITSLSRVTGAHYSSTEMESKQPRQVFNTSSCLPKMTNAKDVECRRKKRERRLRFESVVSQKGEVVQGR